MASSTDRDGVDDGEEVDITITHCLKVIIGGRTSKPAEACRQRRRQHKQGATLRLSNRDSRYHENQRQGTTIEIR